MQTFLPYPDFTASAAVLDARRLGKQRVEALQVLRALTVAGYGWQRHPAVLMWNGYEEALTRYGLTVCEAWSAGGRRDTCAPSIGAGYTAATGRSLVRAQDVLAAAGELPPWLGDEQLHRSHRSALLRKDPEHYAGVFGDVPPDLPYSWPRSDRPERPVAGRVPRP